MFKQRTPFLRFLILLALTFALAGCGTEEIPAPEAPSETVRPVPDVTGRRGDIEAALYGPENPYTGSRLEQELKRQDVRRILAIFESRGYQLAPEHAVIVEGGNRSMSGSAVFLAMRPTEETEGDVALIVSLRVGDKLDVAPLLFTARAPSSASGFRPVTEGLWMKTLLPGKTERSPSRLDQSFWGDFINCMIHEVPGDIAGCIVSCLLLPIGAPVCITACVTGVTVADVIKCMIIAAGSGKWERKKE